jgi:predicted DNA-binding transcriptional regulator AlpA
VPPKLRLNEPLLTAKEVCFTLGWSRTTLWRRKREGCPFVGGRIGSVTLAWWMELRDAARKLGLPVQAVWRLPRRRQEEVLIRAAAKY